jgi:hypothetical protein
MASCNKISELLTKNTSSKTQKNYRIGLTKGGASTVGGMPQCN